MRKAWSQEELRNAALNYMRLDYGLPEKDDLEAREVWRERLGLLVCFVERLWEKIED